MKSRCRPAAADRRSVGVWSSAPKWSFFQRMPVVAQGAHVGPYGARKQVRRGLWSNDYLGARGRKLHSGAASDKVRAHLMDASGSHDSNRAYYDAFSEGYEDQRGENDPGGYHELIDTLEAEFVRRFAVDRDVLEVGCGTGLVLSRIAEFACSARGVDLSPGMLERAHARGLDVLEASATALPFANESFDVTCSFKVLSHVPDIQVALSEMARVTRRGGFVIAEFYNPWSVRGLLKRFGPKGRIAEGADESHVYTRYDSPLAVRRMVPRGCYIAASRGVRIVIPTARVMRYHMPRNLFRAAEWALCDSPLRIFGGFWIAAMEKRL